MKKAILVAIIGAMTLGVNAGDWGKAPVAPSKAPIEECYDLGGEISAGYMSDFILNGSRVGRDTVWTDVNYTIDSIVPITVGASYFAFDEADLFAMYAEAALGTFAGFDTSLSYTHTFFTEGGNGFLSSQGDIGLNLRRSLGFADLLLGTNYNVAGNGNSGWYHQAGVEKAFGLTDAASLVLGTGIGYQDSYWTHGGGDGGSGWANYYVTASLPIELNCRTTLTPYVGYNGGIDQGGGLTTSDSIFSSGGSAGGGDVLHAGVSLSVSF